MSAGFRAPMRKRKPRVQSGDRFNRLTAIEFVGILDGRGSYWKFQCDCGVTKDLSATLVRRGQTKSCGCLKTGRKRFFAKGKSSRITIPEGVHPIISFVFSEMVKQNVTYDELARRSGLLKSTFKAWRQQNNPSVESVEFALRALGFTLSAAKAEAS